MRQSIFLKTFIILAAVAAVGGAVLVGFRVSPEVRRDTVVEETGLSDSYRFDTVNLIIISRIHTLVAGIPLWTFVFWTSPFLALAAHCPPPSPGIYCIEPFTSSTDDVAIICSLATSIRQFALPLAVFAIIFVGVQLVIAAASGNEGKLAQTKSWLWYVVIETAIIVPATILVNAAVRFSAAICGTPIPQACQ
jgi:hypothetical protein